MLQIWSNPEFVRHRRAELCPVRAITVAAIVLAICVLVGLVCWSSQQQTIANLRRAVDQFGTDAWKERLAGAERDLAWKTWLLFYKWLVGIQGTALTFWTLFSCSQSISGERDRKTWDFQRVTRLTPAEILIGKLLGEPVLIYFAVLCATPVTLIAGLASGLAFSTVMSVFLFLLLTSLFLGLAGMWLSTLLESRTRGVGLIGALGLYFITGLSVAMRDSGLPGLAAFSPLMVFLGLLPLANDEPSHSILPLLFGIPVPWLLMCAVLCGSFGAWLVLMLLRNLKRDYSEIRPLSRWQAVGCAAFLNFLIYALLKPPHYFGFASGDQSVVWFANARLLAPLVVGINGPILFLAGLATLTPQERLKVWQRKRAAGEAPAFADDGLPWPWLATSAIVAYVLMVLGLLAWSHALPLEAGTLQTAALQLLVVLVFVTRDVLFLQWCILTRLRQPVVKGFLYLCLYYASAFVLAGMGAVSSEATMHWVLALLTPVQAFDASVSGLAFPGAVYLGLVFQLVLIGTAVTAITNRLKLPTQSGAAASV